MTLSTIYIYIYIYIYLHIDIQYVLILYDVCRVMKVYPNGVGTGKGNSLSIYLLSASNKKGYVKAKFRVINKTPSKNVEKQG